MTDVVDPSSNGKAESCIDVLDLIPEDDMLPHTEYLPFDLEAAKAGAPIMRRNGSKMRFIAFDEKLNLPLVVALVPPEDEGTTCGEFIYSYRADGTFSSGRYTGVDLVMAPVEATPYSTVLVEPRPFDLEAAKAGAPIMRCNGDKVRFIMFDERLKYPLLVARVQPKKGSGERQGEFVDSYNADGTFSNRSYPSLNLLMAPIPMTGYEGWTTVRKGGPGGRLYLGDLFLTPPTQEEIASNALMGELIGVARVSWRGPVETVIPRSSANEY